jgi:hypothetical protein
MRIQAYDVLMLLGVAAAVFAVLPYSWCPIVASAASAAMAVLAGTPRASSIIKSRTATKEAPK